MVLTNNTILITGGASGFGLLFAERLLALGNTVIITGRNQAKLDAAQQQLPGIHTFRSDVSDPAAIAQLYVQVTSHFPGLNMLINNAGEMRKISLHSSMQELPDITREIDINLLGPIRMVQQFLPHLRTQQTAAILNVTSGIALVPFPVSPVYGASKAGLRSYTQSLRVQLRNTPVKVFELVAPAAKTPLNDPFLHDPSLNQNLFMDPGKLIAIALKGLQHNKTTIYPGMARILRWMSRLAPAFLLRETSKAGADFYLSN